MRIRLVIGIMLLCAGSFAASPKPDGGPYTETVDGVTWKFMVTNGMASVGSSPSLAVPAWTSGHLKIPSVLGGCVVTNIGQCAFEWCSDLTDVTIPESIVSIEEDAFSSCLCLTNVVIPMTVKSIGARAFNGCRDLRRIVIQSAETSVHRYSFYGCDSLEACLPGWNCGLRSNWVVTKLVINNGVETIRRDAFENYSALTSVLIPLSVTNIEDRAFANCNALTAISIPRSVKTIGSYVFTGDAKLMSIDVDPLNDHYASKDGVLYNKTYTELVLFPSGKTAGIHTLPSTVTNIESGALQSVSGIVIPASVQSIESAAFSYLPRFACFEGGPPSGLSNSSLSSSATVLYNSAYEQEWLPVIEDCGLSATPYDPSAPLPNGGPYLDCVDGIVWTFMVTNGEAAVCYHAVDPVVGDVEIPSSLGGRSVTRICEGAFYRSSGLTSVKIPSCVKCIEARAFEYCYNLTNVVMNQGVSEIGENAFESCHQLSVVKIPSSVSNIGHSAFAYCYALTSIEIPSGLANIEISTFYHCEVLAKLSIPASVSHIGESAFSCCPQLGEGVVVVDGCVLTVNGECPENLVLPEDVRLLADGVFRGNTSLTSVTIPSGVTNVWDHAFEGCYYLTNVVIPDGVTHIGDFAFAECGLHDAAIPSSVRSIGDSAFYYCGGVTSLVLPNGLERIGGSAFECCSLTNIVIPSNVETIGARAFAGCWALTEVTICDGVEYIDEYAFSDCPLTAVVIPSSVTQVGAGAFAECVELTDVTICEGVRIIGECAFQGCGFFEDISLPSSVTSIGAYAFDSGMTHMTIPSSVRYMGACVFGDYPSLQSIDFEGAPPAGDGVSTLYCDAVLRYNKAYREEWTDVISKYDYNNEPYNPAQMSEGGPYTEIVDGVEWTFMVTNGGASVGTGMSGGTAVSSSLTGSLLIPSALGARPVSSVGDHAFDGCSGLTDIRIASTVESIGERAFAGCAGLSYLLIPEGISSIGVEAFGACNHLMALDFEGGPPSGLAHASVRPDALIRYNVEYASRWLLMIEKCGFANARPYHPDGGPYREFVDGIEWTFVIKNGEAVVGTCSSVGTAIPTTTKGGVVIPSQLGGCMVTGIGDYAFYGCSKLADVSIPSSVKSIGFLAFSGCTALGDGVVMRDGCVLTVNGACPDALTLPESVRLIAGGAFYGCKELTSVVLPPSVMNVGRCAFANCSGLGSVTFEGRAPTCGEDVFAGCSSTMLLHVQKGSVGWTQWGGRSVSFDANGGDEDVSRVSLTVTNVVVHCIVNSYQPESAAPVSEDTGFVNVITEVKSGGAVSIPETWASLYPSFTERYGANFVKALMKPSGKVDGGGKAMFVWQDYVAGTDPTKPDDKFMASVTIVDGVPVVSWAPELSAEQAALRAYTIYGKAKLQDADWMVVNGDAAKYNFFKVSVEMK